MNNCGQSQSGYSLINRITQNFHQPPWKLKTSRAWMSRVFRKARVCQTETSLDNGKHLLQISGRAKSLGAAGASRTPVQHTVCEGERVPVRKRERVWEYEKQRSTEKYESLSNVCVCVWLIVLPDEHWLPAITKVIKTGFASLNCFVCGWVSVCVCVCVLCSCYSRSQRWTNKLYQTSASHQHNFMLHMLFIAFLSFLFSWLDSMNF